MTEQKEHSFQKVHLPLFLVQLCFASLPIYSKIAFQTFGPSILTFIRILGTALIFSLMFFFFKKEKIKDKKHLLHFAFLAIFGVSGNIYFYLKGLSLSTAINATIIVSSIPIFTLLVALILRQESFSLGKMIGVIVAFSGVGILINIGNIQMGDYLLGNMFILLNSLLYSIFLVLMKPYYQLYKPFTIITYVFIFASIEIIPLTYFEVLKFDYLSVPLENYFPLAMVLIAGTFIPYLLNSFALKHAPSSFVAIYIYLQPVLASIMAVLMLGEIVTIKVVISAALIILGVTIVRFPRILLLKRNK